MSVFRRAFALPVVDVIKKTHMVRSYREQIDSQWKSRGQIEAVQVERMRRLLLHAQQNVPYYERLFANVGFDVREFHSPARLSVLPILTKSIIREQFSQLQARNMDQFAPRRNQTSGSTGQPLVFFWDRDAHSAGWPNAWRGFSVAGFTLGDAILVLSGGALMPKVTPLMQRVYYKFMGITQLRAYHLSEDEIRSYFDYLDSAPSHPQYMYAYASAAYLLARYSLLQGRRDIRFKAVFTTAEVLAPGYRDTIEEAFHCKVYDSYGNNEGCLAAFECERQDGLHYAMENACLEVLDDEGRPVGPGETGHFIATNLMNYAMPFIRYDTGDLGSLRPEPCACGRGLTRIAGIMGRTRDFIYTPDGREIHGAFFNHFEPFYRTAWIAGWRVRQDRLDHLEICIRPDGEPREEDIAHMRELLTRALGQEMNIDFVMNPQLSVTPAGKQKVIECLIEKPAPKEAETH